MEVSGHSRNFLISRLAVTPDPNGGASRVASNCPSDLRPGRNSPSAHNELVGRVLDRRLAAEDIPSPVPVDLTGNPSAVRAAARPLSASGESIVVVPWSRATGMLIMSIYGGGPLCCWAPCCRTRRGRCGNSARFIQRVFRPSRDVNPVRGQSDGRTIASSAICHLLGGSASPCHDTVPSAA